MEKYYENYKLCQAIEDIEDLQEFIEESAEDGLFNSGVNLLDKLEDYRQVLLERLQENGGQI